jgi:hypothetical protein
VLKQKTPLQTLNQILDDFSKLPLKAYNARIIGGLVWLKLAKDERLPSVRRPLLMRLLGVFIT